MIMTLLAYRLPRKRAAVEGINTSARKKHGVSFDTAMGVGMAVSGFLNSVGPVLVLGHQAGA